MNPLKQGLKLGKEIVMKDMVYIVKVVNPLKQGLKPECCRKGESNGNSVKVVNPLKQGLKLIEYYNKTKNAN